MPLPALPRLTRRGRYRENSTEEEDDLSVHELCAQDISKVKVFIRRVKLNRKSLKKRRKKNPELVLTNLYSETLKRLRKAWKLNKKRKFNKRQKELNRLIHIRDGLLMSVRNTTNARVRVKILDTLNHYTQYLDEVQDEINLYQKLKGCEVTGYIGKYDSAISKNMSEIKYHLKSTDNVRRRKLERSIPCLRLKLVIVEKMLQILKDSDRFFHEKGKKSMKERNIMERSESYQRECVRNLVIVYENMVSILTDQSRIMR